MILPKWEELSVMTRRSRKKLYKLIQEEITENNNSSSSIEYGNIQDYCIIIQQENYSFLDEDLTIPLHDLTSISFESYDNAQNSIYFARERSIDNLCFEDIPYALPSGIYRVNFEYIESYNEGEISVTYDVHFIKVTLGEPIRLIITENSDTNEKMINVQYDEDQQEE